MTPIRIRDLLRPSSILMLVGWLVSAISAPAQEEQGRLRVGLYQSPPFVMAAGTDPSGMAVDLWELLADSMQLGYDYAIYDTIAALVDATASGEVDVAVTSLTITHERAERLAFTQPWYDGGMRIMVGEDTGWQYRDVIAGLSDAGHLRVFALIGGVILFATLILTLFDRRFDPTFPKEWQTGLAESFYNVMSVAALGEMKERKNHFGWVGRIWQALLLVSGVAILAYATSSVTSVMTTVALTRQIHSVEDLPAKTVAVLEGSVAADLAASRGFKHRIYERVADAAAALGRDEVDAVVADAAVLEYYVHTHPGSALAVVGPIFEPDKYGFGLPADSALEKRLTLGILATAEAGEIATLRARYFGMIR